MAGHPIDPNTVEDRHQRARPGRFNVRWLPPHGRFLEKLVCDGAGALPLWRVGQFLVATENDHTHPLLLAHDLVDLDTNPRVGTHPLDLLPNRGKAIEGVIMVGEVYGHDIGLSPVRARSSTLLRFAPKDARGPDLRKSIHAGHGCPNRGERASARARAAASRSAIKIHEIRLNPSWHRRCSSHEWFIGREVWIVWPSHKEDGVSLKDPLIIANNGPTSSATSTWPSRGLPSIRPI